MKEEGFEQLTVYKLAYGLAMKIFQVSKDFPKEEKYALTDQIRRSSRSVCSNIAEAYRKRQYPKHYESKMSDADGECSETLVWLSFSCDCKYLTVEQYEPLRNDCQEVGKMLGLHDGASCGVWRECGLTALHDCLCGVLSSVAYGQLLIVYC